MDDKAMVNMIWDWEINKITWPTQDVDADEWGDSDLYRVRHILESPNMWMICENTPEGIAKAKRILINEWMQRVVEATSQVQTELVKERNRAEADGGVSS